MTPPPVPAPPAEPARLNDTDVSRVRDDTVRRARSQAGAASTIRADQSSLAGALYGQPKQLLGQ